MKVSDIVKIVRSCDLTESKLEELIGRDAIVTEVKENGSWVRLFGGAYEGEDEWFIPKISLKKNNKIIF